MKPNDFVWLHPASQHRQIMLSRPTVSPNIVRWNNIALPGKSRRSDKSPPLVKIPLLAALFTGLFTIAFAGGVIAEQNITAAAEPVSDNNYLVLGSFAKRANALSEVNRITEITSLEVLLMESTAEEYNYYRLLIGPISEFDESFYRTLAAEAGIKAPWMMRNVRIGQQKAPRPNTRQPSRGEVEPRAVTAQKSYSLEIKATSKTNKITLGQSTQNTLPGNPSFNLASLSGKNSNGKNSYAKTSSTISTSNFTGYIKSFAVAQGEISSDVLNVPTTYQSQNAVRLMWENFSGNQIIQIHYEISPVFLSRQQPIDSPTFNIVGDTYRLVDISSSLSSSDSKNQVYQNLDRLNIQFQFDHGDLTIGRQAISFGSARIINPTDIFLPFDVQTFNQEYRAGVDAIRYQTPLGELGEIDVGLVLGKDAKPENSAAFLQIRGNHNGKDLQMALTRFAEQTMLGAGIQTAIGDIGFWFEIANVWGDIDYLRTSTGFDYAFSENTFAMIEYHYNGAGAKDPAEYLQLLGTIPYQRGGVFLLGQEYIIPSLSFQISPLWNLAVQGIYNLTDDSAFLSLTAQYNLAENFYTDVGYYHFLGDKITLVAPGIPTLRSEYGTNPDVIYASLRFYF